MNDLYRKSQDLVQDAIADLDRILCRGGEAVDCQKARALDVPITKLVLAKGTMLAAEISNDNG